MSAIIFSTAIGPVPIDVIVKEKHRTELGITQTPIETGAEITDHAYVKPKRLTLEIGDNAGAETFNALVRFQESRVPFTVVSGLFVYSNMLISSTDFTRDAAFSKTLNGQVELQEIIIVGTAYAVGPEGEANSPASQSKGTSKRPTRETAKDSVTKDRAAGTIHRGDAPVSTTPTTGNSPEAIANRSMLSRVF